MQILLCVKFAADCYSVKLLAHLLSTTYRRQKIISHGRGTVSPNPKAGSQDRKRISGVGPRHLGHARYRAGLPPWTSATVSVPLCAGVRVLCEGWRGGRRLRRHEEYVILREAGKVFNRGAKDHLHPLSSGKLLLACVSFAEPDVFLMKSRGGSLLIGL